MPALQKIEPMVEAHEDRIQRLEQGLSEVRVELATNSERLNAVVNKLDEIIPTVQGAIENCISPITQRLSDHLASDEKIHSEVAAALPRLQSLEDAYEKKKERKKAWKGFWYAVAVAGGGILTKELAVKLFTFYFHHN